MCRSFTIRRSRSLFLLLAITASLLAVLALATEYSPTLLARRLQHALETLPHEEVPRQMKQLSSLGDAGMAVLVAALGSQRQAVAQAAHEELQTQVNRWRMRDSSESSRKVAGLVHELAQHVGRYNREAQLVAADLATQVLLWPIDKQTVDYDRLTDDCKLVLRASGKQIAPARRDQALPIENTGLDITPDVPGIPSKRFRTLNTPSSR